MSESAPPRRSAAPQTCQATGLAPRTGASAPARFLHVRLLSRGVVCRRNRACAEPPMGSGLTRTENDPLGPSRIVARGSSFYPAALERVAVRASLPCPSPISTDTQTGSNVSAAMGPHLRDRLPDRKSRTGKVSPRPRRTIWISQETTSRIRSVSRWRLTCGAEQRSSRKRTLAVPKRERARRHCSALSTVTVAAPVSFPWKRSRQRRPTPGYRRNTWSSRGSRAATASCQRGSLRLPRNAPGDVSSGPTFLPWKCLACTRLQPARS